MTHYLHAATGLFSLLFRKLRSAEALAFLLLSATFASAAPQDGPLRIELTTAYNFIVDSNVETPATYAPRSAYISARIWNDGATPITDVRAYIGNKINNTPGIYPSRVHDENTNITGPLTGGAFALTHEGGTMGTSDATRPLGTIPPGGYIPVYWLVSYPNLDENDVSVTGGIKPDDDLFLFYDIWATGNEGATARAVDVRRRATMRSCISAMANKIFPNTANKVPQLYQDILDKFQPEWNDLPADGTPGTRIVTEGIWYDLGNVNKGFDNDGNLVPDQNAWLQPVGDPALFDPSAFRLVNSFALVVVKLKSGGEAVYDVTDQLYFTNLPDNTGVIGLVRYDYLALQPNATSATTPYQMAASGFDNEKFNGDYGTSFTLSSPPSPMTLEKSVDKATATPSETLAYNINFENPGTQPVGDPSLGMALVINETIPPGTAYVAGTAATGNTLPTGVTAYEIRYSTNNGTTWTTIEPSPASDVTDIQWWLSDVMASSTSGTVTFSVVISDPYPFGGQPVLNIAGLSFGGGVPFLEDDAITFIPGDYNISGTVFEDIGTGTGGAFGDGILNGTEPGIPNVTVRLYYDTNGDGILDGDEILISTMGTSAITTGTYQFTDLPNGNYIVQVDRLDTDIPTGYTITSSETIAVTINNADSTDNDFGFAPTLLVTKSGTESVYEGEDVQYTINVSNNYPGAGVQKNYDLWTGTATSAPPANKQWTNPANAQGAPDGNVASAIFSNAKEELSTSNFTPALPAGNITKVELILRARTTGFQTGDGSTLDFDITGTTFTGNASYPVNAFSLDSATLLDGVYDITAGKTLTDWNLTDFAAQAMTVTASKAGNPGTVDVYIDAVGFRITTTESATLNPVPLTDTYNADELEFVSAIPAQDSASVVGSVGTLNWDNIGPLAPGDSSSVTVNFIAKKVPNGVPIITTDTAIVTGATFENGTPANDGEDTADTEIKPTASIGDTIFVDANRSGSQDLGEPGIVGVTVELLDSNNNVIATDVTDANGNYLFENLIPGTYTVRVVTGTGTPLEGWTLSADPDLDGEPFDPANPDPLGDNQTTQTLVGGQFFSGADFGYFPPGYALSGILWIDFNGDGIVDENEIGLQYVTVDLYDSNDTLIGTTITDSEGAYTFAGLTNGDYYTVVDGTTLPTGLTQTFEADATINNRNDVTIAGADELDVNFGYQYVGTNTLSGTVGLDDPTRDGLLNGTNPSGVDGSIGEVAYGGVEITIYAVIAGETTLLTTTTTDANGDYSIVGLPVADSYIVALNAPFDNLLLTTTATSSLGTFDHPANQVVVSSDSQGYTTGAYAVVPYALDIENMDFAFESAVEYDFGDLPDSYRTLLANDGARHIIPDPLNPTLYLGLGVDTEPEGQPSAGANLDTFDDGVEVVGIWSNGPGGGSVQIDVVGTGWLVGFIDFNNDGNLSTVGDLIASQAVTTGTYTINFDIPAGSIADQGTTSFYSRFRLFPQAPNYPELAFRGEAINGEVEDYQWNFHSIGDFVWVDTNGNGIQDAGEIGLPGVTVQLLDASNNPVLDGNGDAITTITDDDGFYSFTGLPVGTYRVRFVRPEGYAFSPQGEGSNQALDSDPDRVTGITDDVVITSGQSRSDIDAGVYLQACPDTWAAWQAKWTSILGNDNVGLTDNPDGDRYSNLIEYAFCLPPNLGVGKPFCLFDSEDTPGGVDGLFSRTAIGGAKDVTYVLEWTAALGSPTTWTSVTLDANNTEVTNDGNGKEIVRIANLQGLTSLPDAGFVRIRVDLLDDLDEVIATDATDVLGWVKTEFGTCCSTYCNPLLECAVFTGTVDSVSGQDLVLTTSATGFDLGTLLEPGVAYYIEVESGTLEGHRFDITAGGVASLTLANDADLFAFGAPFNTLTGATSADLAGGRIAVHRHKTLNSMFPPSDFNATESATNADRVQFNISGQWHNYWLYENQGAARWVTTENMDLDDMGGLVIPPGRGMFFDNRSGSAAPVIAFGEVREHAFVNPLPTGSSLIAGGYPVDQAPRGDDSRKMNLAATVGVGFFGSRNFATADSIFRWRADSDPDAGGYDTYFLASVSSGNFWYYQPELPRVDRSLDKIFDRNRSVFLRVRDGYETYQIPAPWSPAPLQPDP